MSAATHDVASKGYHVRDACPCCGASVTRATMSVASKRPAEQLPLEEHTRFSSGYGANRSYFTYYRCGECGGLYCPIFYSGDQLAALYGHQSENMSEVPLEARKRTQERYGDALLAHTPNGGDYLEIGADIGLLADKCAREAQFENLWLYEPNIDVRDELQQRLRMQSNTVLDKMLPGDEVAAGSVSAAAMVHVLDHLIDPLEMLKTLNAKMSRGAALLIVAHNSSSMLARALGRRFPPFALQHPQIFDRTSLKVLLARAGFSMAETQGAVNYFPFWHLARAACAVAGITPSIGEATYPVIPIRLGNMLVVARKD